MNRVFRDYFFWRSFTLFLSFFFFFVFCVGDFQVLTRGSEFKFFGFCIHVLSYIYFERKKKKEKNKLKKFSSLVCRQMNSPHNMFSAASSQIHIICFQTSVFVYHLSYRLFFFFFLISIYFNFFNKQTSRDLKSQMSAHEHTQRNVDFFQQH